ncbi:MAG TPA: heparan-alpha-glucosaminide N-acetyltransferase domain-containing protein [Vicinamibacterales bacterium]|nr:heparan-alpha-glucosaminide N-acetyltransferase domain-containing protein [Vicinamibacterales bacterium]
MSAHPNRVRSLDIARGLVMVLMAIDHVRVYAAVPAGGPAPAIFFTRWVTHFCAPGFVFFAGASAWLHRATLPGVPALSRFLLIRGLWLIFLELTVMRFAWTFNFDVMNYNLAGVLWMIGWSMVALAGLVWLPFSAIAATGLAIIVGHNLIDPYVRDLGGAIADNPLRWVFQFLYFGGSVSVGESGPRIAILYSLLPWIGVMAAGYAFGAVLELPEPRRRKICIAIGATAIVMFLVLRAFNIYGDPRHWSPQQPLLFLNTTKYPASLLFLLMTLGPLILLLPAFDRARGAIASGLETFGRVPLFYYVLHIPLIHLAAIAISLIRTGTVTPWLFGNHPLEPPEPPDGYRWSLTLLYLVTAVCVATLYLACRWYVRRKAVVGSGKLTMAS